MVCHKVVNALPQVLIGRLERKQPTNVSRACAWGAERPPGSWVPLGVRGLWHLWGKDAGVLRLSEAAPERRGQGKGLRWTWWHREGNKRWEWARRGPVSSGAGHGGHGACPGQGQSRAGYGCEESSDSEHEAPCDSAGPERTGTRSGSCTRHHGPQGSGRGPEAVMGEPAREAQCSPREGQQQDRHEAWPGQSRMVCWGAAAAGTGDLEDSQQGVDAPIGSGQTRPPHRAPGRAAGVIWPHRE